MMNNVDTVLVGYSYQDGNDILIIARKQLNQEPDIINAIEGPEARNIYEKLIGKIECTREATNEGLD